MSDLLKENLLKGRQAEGGETVTRKENVMMAKDPDHVLMKMVFRIVHFIMYAIFWVHQLAGVHWRHIRLRLRNILLLAHYSTDERIIKSTCL